MNLQHQLAKWRTIVQPERIQRFVTNTPRRRYLALRRANHSGPRVLANSIPKSGTFLLERCLNLMPDMVNYHQGVFVYGQNPKLGILARANDLQRMGGGTFVQVHMPHAPEVATHVQRLNMRHVLIIRDPRDIAVSQVKFQLGRPDLPHHLLFASYATDNERYQAFIHGTHYTRPNMTIDVVFRLYLEWLAHVCLVVKFEDLVGPNGGGTAARQTAAVQAIGQHIGLPLSDEQIGNIASQLFNPQARTFRQGKQGGWRAGFSAETKTCFKEIAGDLLVELGYEQDHNW